MNAANWDQWILETRDEVPKARLFEMLLPVQELRRIAKARGLKPQGFRVERAPAGHLAREIARQSTGDAELRASLVLLLTSLSQAPEPAGEVAPDSAAVDCAEQERLLESARAEQQRLERALRKAERSAKKARDSLSEAIAERDAAKEAKGRNAQHAQGCERQLESLGKSYEALKAQLAAAQEGSRSDEQTALRRQVEELEARDLELRRVNAELASSQRELSEQLEELESMLPRGQRERLRWRDKAARPALEGGGYLPRFEPGFFRALAALERADELRVWAAISQLLLHGTEPKGLAFKALQGPGKIHSIRAASHLRVYFLRDGDVLVFEHAGHREEQDHYLKRRRDQ